MDICFCKSLKDMTSKGLLLLGEDSNHEGDKIRQKGATKIHTAMITPVIALHDMEMGNLRCSG
jgi:hypothetical protein